jgi:hypothetical protein
LRLHLAPHSGLQEALLWIAVLTLYWASAFYPFRWDPPRLVTNQARRLPDGSLRLGDPSIVRSTGAVAWLDKAVACGCLTVDLEVWAGAPVQEGPARIFTVSKDTRHTNLTVAQQGSDLVLRLRRSGSDVNGLLPLRVPGVFREPGWRHITVDIARGALRVNVDGAPLIRETLGPDPLRSWDRSFHLALGNELTLGRPWVGDVRRVRVRVEDELVDILEPGGLEIPAEWQYVPARLRAPLLWFGGAGRVLDVVLNLAAFLPLGWILAAFRRLPLVWVVAVCTALSLSMEVGQIFFDERVPSLIDLAVNVVGGVLGAILATRMGTRAITTHGV